MLKALEHLDRRWIFLLMGLAVAVPILVIGVTGKTFPEKPTPLAQSVFDAVNDLPSGSKILLGFDFDPASEGELGPMATSFVRHCAEKGHKMYFMALWPVGPQMVAAEHPPRDRRRLSRTTSTARTTSTWASRPATRGSSR